MFTEDYILRMIRDMARMLGKLMGRDTENPYAVSETEKISVTGEPPLLERLKQLADQGQINQAENMLFEETDFTDSAGFSSGLSFYEYLNGFSDAKLELAGYSREEIFEGLRDYALKFGMDKSLLDAFDPS